MSGRGRCLKILIAGCNGLLGQNLLRTGSEEARFELSGLGLKPDPARPDLLSSYHCVDLGDRRALQNALDQIRPDWILNAAAMTDVDGCERDPGRCDLLNRDAVGWMAETGIPLAHVSTDYIFDGTSGPYVETNRPNPLSRYGRAKLESETLALSGSPRSFVVRTMLLWGRGQGTKKSFNDFVRENLTAGKSIRVVTDQLGSPTLAHDLAAAIWALIRAGKAGIYHAAGADVISRFDLAKGVAHFYGLDASLIHPIVTPDLRQAAPRPLRSGLNCDKLERDTGFRPRGWHAQMEWWRDLPAQAGS